MLLYGEKEGTKTSSAQSTEYKNKEKNQNLYE